ncbi:MAG: nickel-responsive transcriptional regulator NikR [Phyllobacteriaceae bacterium]|nr:nickel-responsive transcriptional regulator NikR [Phyllobacteriaceae bacterium]
MQRVTFTFDDDLMGEIDRFMETRGYSNRSEAVRDLTRAGLAHGIEIVGESRDCVASFTFVFDPETRELAKRLANAYRERPDIRASRMQQTLPNGEILEITALHGETMAVHAFAEAIRAERGVRNGELVIVPV